MYSETQGEAIRVMNQVLNYVEAFGLPRSRWFFGITDEPPRRLPGEHRVALETDPHICLPVSNTQTAKFVEGFLTDDVFGGFDGGPGGHTQGKFVYAYLKQPHTRR